MFYNEQRKPYRTVPKKPEAADSRQCFLLGRHYACLPFYSSFIHLKLALESDFIFKYEPGDVAKTTFPQAFQLVLNFNQVFSQNDRSFILQVGFDLMKRNIRST